MGFRLDVSEVPAVLPSRRISVFVCQPSTMSRVPPQLSRYLVRVGVRGTVRVRVRVRVRS